MKVAFLGFVSAIEEYTDKKTGQVVRNASIASTNQMMKVRIGENDQYEEMDQVLVGGDIKVYERNFYLENPFMRLANASDREFMKGAPLVASDGPQKQNLNDPSQGTPLANGRKVAAA